MKKMFKVMLLVLCAALLVAGRVLGTLAYLQMKTGTVTNTFTVGQVAITLQEYGINADGSKDTSTTTTTGISDIKLVPGRVIEKNPFIKVAANSEECYLFAKVVNGLGDDATIAMAAGWTQVTGTDYWVYGTKVAANAEVDIFTSFKCSTGVENGKTYTNNAIAVTAYAIQAEGFADAQAAWAASGFGA